MLIGSLMVLSGLPDIYASDTTALQLANSGGNTSIVRTEMGTLGERQEGSASSYTMALHDDATSLAHMSESQLVSRINLRKLENASRIGNSNKVRVTVQDYVDPSDGSLPIPVGEGTSKEATLQARLINIENLDTETPKAVCELFAVFSGIEHADREEVIVEKNSRKAEAKITGYEKQDQYLKPIIEVILPTADGQIIVDEKKVREVSYTLDGSEWGKEIGDLENIPDDDSHAKQKREKFERWKRPDGTFFERTIEDYQTVDKPKPPAPVPSKPSTKWIPIIVHQRTGDFFSDNMHHWQKGSVEVPIDDSRTQIDEYRDDRNGPEGCTIS